MLNRRILRVKAMQALYGHFTAIESLKEVKREELREMHALDPAKHDFADKPIFEERKKLAVKLFNQNHLKDETEAPKDADPEVVASVNNAVRDFQSLAYKESKARRADMLNEADRIWHSYLKILSLGLEFEQREKLEKEREEKAKVNRKEYTFPFIDHPVFKLMTENDDLKSEFVRHAISWDVDQDEIKLWYRDQVKRSEVLAEFIEDDYQNLVAELYRKVIFKAEPILTYFASQHLYWEENFPIIKSMVNKTIKGITNEGEVQLAEISKNGDVDIKFFETLFKDVVDQNDFLEEIIQKSTQNWDVDRIALTDRILLKLAVVEMMSSPSIPIKVSINEVIEISKSYSTPKSNQFINGVLDVLAKELTSSGKIRKSGRGLIDNK